MNDLVHHTRAAAAPGVQPSARQDQIQRPLQPNQARKRCVPPPAGEPQADFGLPDGDARRLRGEPVVAGQRQLQASAKGRAVDGGDRRAGQPRQLVADGLKASARGFDVVLPWLPG